MISSKVTNVNANCCQSWDCQLSNNGMWDTWKYVFVICMYSGSSYGSKSLYVRVLWHIRLITKSLNVMGFSYDKEVFSTPHGIIYHI